MKPKVYESKSQQITKENVTSDTKLFHTGSSQIDELHSEHTNEKIETNDTKPISMKRSQINESKPHRCTECGKEFSRKYSLKRHEKMRDGIGPEKTHMQKNLESNSLTKLMEEVPSKAESCVNTLVAKPVNSGNQILPKEKRNGQV